MTMKAALMNSQASAVPEPRSPRIVSCSGPTPRARRAGEIAARLRLLETVTAAGSEAIAIDGCESACASRRLAAKGVRTAAIGLHELDQSGGGGLDERAFEALLDRVVEALRVLTPSEAAAHRRAPQPPAAGLDERRSHTTADYLFAVYTLTSPVVECGAVASDLPTLGAHIARALSISRPAAGEALARLEQRGLIERGPGKEILLTQRGRDEAENVVRRHRVAERFLTDVLDYSPAESYELALRLRAGFDDSIVERLVELLPPPACCPHGWPFDPAADGSAGTKLPQQRCA